MIYKQFLSVNEEIQIIYFSWIVKSCVNPFLEPTSPKQ